MSDNVRFDPRFDPAFQPGYEGPIAPVAPASRQRPSTAAPVALPPVAPVYEPVMPKTPAATAPEIEEDAPPRRANPFLIALGAVAAVLVGGALYLISRLRDLFADTQSSSTFDYVTLQVMLFAAPLLLVLGLATGVGLLFVFALRSDRR